LNEIGANRQTSPGKIRLNTYLDRWLKAVKPRVTDKTYQTYAWLLDRHIRPALGVQDAARPGKDRVHLYEKRTAGSLKEDCHV
jgi:hypothetical protein